MSIDIFKPNKKEQKIRWMAIVAMSAGLALAYNLKHLSWEEFTKYFIIAFIQCAVYWNGTILVTLLVSKLFPMEKNLNLAIVMMFLIVSIMVVLVGLLLRYILINYCGLNFSWRETVTQILMSLSITYFISTFYAANYFFVEWRENALKAQMLEKANLEARFETLKTQINPHFLFNSLNTLITLVSDNPTASKYVESLSEFMRYLLQNQSKEAVLVRDELKVAGEYVFLQQYRFGNKLNVNIDVTQKHFHYAIAPLSVQMLLENAIKHNVISSEHPLNINIYIENDSYLVVENNLQPKLDSDPSTGLGLNNIKNRYKFLNEKEVLVLKEKTKFIVKLPLFEVSL